MTTRKAPIPTERQVQQSVRAWLKRVLPGCRSIHIPNQNVAHSDNYRAALVKDGMLPGAPDLVVVLPDRQVIWLEVKRPGGEVSLRQQRVHAELLSVGHAVGVVDSIESARHVLAAAGIRLMEQAGQPARPAVVKLEKPRASIGLSRIERLRQEIPF